MYMNNLIEQEIFDKVKIDINKLEDFGFIRTSNCFNLERDLLENDFKVQISVDFNGVLKGEVIDKSLNEPYEAFRRTFGLGGFASNIKEEYVKILEQIKIHCSVPCLFSSPQAERINIYIKEKYNVDPEYPWTDDINKEHCIYRNKDNDKWFSIIMHVEKGKVTKTSDLNKVYVMNVKIDENKLNQILSMPGFYECYHMNKKQWISIILDDSLDDDIIKEFIDVSYSFFKRKTHYLSPANSSWFDLTTYFNNKENINNWKQYPGCKVGDILYIYATVPYSCIMYKTVVLQTDIPWPVGFQTKNKNQKMILVKVLERYPYNKYTLKTISSYGVKTVRGTRSMPKELLDYMNEEN